MSILTAEMTGKPIDHTALAPQYTLTENAKLELDTLFEAMETVSLIVEAPEHARGPDLDAEHFAAVYRALSFLGTVSYTHLTLPTIYSV